MIEQPGAHHQGAVKNDQGKVRLELLSPAWLLGVGRVLTFGATKYADHNWRKGLKRTRLLGAALRHIVADLAGEDIDPESGEAHLDHASCCLMFASELRVTRPDLDDRWKGDPTRECGHGANDSILRDGVVIIKCRQCGWERELKP